MRPTPTHPVPGPDPDRRVEVVDRRSPAAAGSGSADASDAAGSLAAQLRLALPGAAEPSLAALVGRAQVRPFRRHSRVLSQDRAPLLTLVLDGHLGAVRSSADGRQQMITIVGPGEIAGILSLARDAPSVDLVGLSRGAVALWPGDVVIALAGTDGGLAVALLDHALRSAARLLNRLEHVTFDSVSRRLAAILWRRRDLLFDARRPLLSRPQLADLAGTSREMAGRVIRDFEQRGLIARVGATGLVLLDPEGLRAAGGLDADDGRHGGHP